MIPLSIPNISGNELKYVKDCLDTGWISSAGEYVNKFEEGYSKLYGSKICYCLHEWNSWFTSFACSCRSY